MNLNFNKLTLRTMITQNRKKIFFLLGENREMELFNIS